MWRADIYRDADLPHLNYVADLSKGQLGDSAGSCERRVWSYSFLSRLA